MIAGLFSMMFVISLILLIIQTIFFKKQTSPYYSLLFAAITVTNLGYMQLVTAESLETALTANQIVYLGSCFLPFLSFACVADLCHLRQRMRINIPSIAVACTIYAGVLSIGNSDIFYKSVSLMRTDGFSYLLKEYGPLHILYPAYMILLMGAAIGVILYSFKRRKQISYVVSIVLTILMTLQLITYILERALHSRIDFIPFAMVISQIGTLLLLDRIKMYDVSSISGNTMTHSYDYGFVICTKSGRLAGTDVAAKKWFPELNDIYIDSVIKKNDTDFLRQLHRWFNGSDTRDTVYFERNGQIIEAKYSVIRETTRKGLHYISLRDDTHQQKYTRLMETYNEDLEQRVHEKTDKLEQIQNDIILSMASIVENRDNNTGGHIKRTSDIVNIFVKRLMKKGCFNELTPEIAECIVKAAPLHDFGKIAIPDVILNKPGKFTDDEYEIMKKHSEKGAVIVSGILQNSDNITFKNIAVNIANYHHEKWNGKGYPSGLREKGIPFEARVMALADVFDALVSKRVYKDSMDFDKAFDIINDSGGSHFDPVLCYEFMQCRKDLEKLYISYND